MSLLSWLLTGYNLGVKGVSHTMAVDDNCRLSRLIPDCDVQTAEHWFAAELKRNSTSESDNYNSQSHNAIPMRYCLKSCSNRFIRYETDNSIPFR